MTWRESRPNLAKHPSYHNVSKILLVQESNVSSELNSDLVVRLCFSQEEGHCQLFIICKTCVYKKSVKNELKVQTIWATVLPDVVRSGFPPRTTSAGFSSSSESRSLSSSPPPLSGKRSSTSFWYRRDVSHHTSVNFTKSHPFSKCFSLTLLTIASRWIRALSFKVNSRQSSNEETNNSISQKEFSSLSVTSATTIPTKKGPLFGYPRMWSRLTTTTLLSLLASNKMAPLTASCSISVTTVSLAVRSSVVEKSNGLGG